MNSSAERHNWLEAVMACINKRYVELGHDVPPNLRVSIGWPKGGGAGHTIGQCFFAAGSADEHNELFISPELGNPQNDTDTSLIYSVNDEKLSPLISTAIRIMDVLAHEVGHAIGGKDAKHGKRFREIVTDIGLEGRMTATTAGPKFVAWAARELLTLGPYPAGKLMYIPAIKRASPFLKCSCGTCGYIIRTTKKWLDDKGPPYCAEVEHGQMERGEDGGGGDDD